MRSRRHLSRAWERRRAARDDSGFTLVELLVAMGVFSLLLAITFPVLNTFFNVDDGLAQTITAENALLPATTTFERYLRSAVEPAPAVGVTQGIPGTPVPPFVPVTGTSPTTYQMGTNALAFYSNVGNANGPELVRASVTPTGTGANGKQLYTLTITATVADLNTCPGSGASMSTATNAKCTYTTNPAKPIAVITGVTNGSSTAPTPIFQYSIASNTDGTPTWAPSTGSTAPTTWTCTSSTSCNPASLTAMQLNIQTQSNVGGLSSIQTVVYFQAITYTTGVG